MIRSHAGSAQWDLDASSPEICFVDDQLDDSASDLLGCPAYLKGRIKSLGGSL